MSLNPWLALIIGFLFGWLLAWLLELWFFRRRRLECQRRLAQVEGDLRARDMELQHARAHADSLEADLTALRARPPVAAADADRLSARLEAPAVAFGRPEVEVAAPRIAAELPEVAAPEIAAELPEVGLPEVELPEVAAPEIAVGLPEVELSEVAAPEIAVELPPAEMPAAEVAWPEVAARVAEVEAGLTAPGMPHIGAELSGGVELPEAAVEALAPDVTAGFVADDLTRVPGIGPKYAAQLAAAGEHIIRTSSAGGREAVSCPQDLSRVKGIGSVYEGKLYAAGIGTFWELSQADEARLAAIFALKNFQDVDLAAIKADALRLAEETGTLNRTWDGTPPDDFEPLEGIGEVYEGRLYDAGICSFRALANATVEQLAEICKAPEWRKPDYAGWIAQAKKMIGQENGITS